MLFPAGIPGVFSGTSFVNLLVLQVEFGSLLSTEIGIGGISSYRRLPPNCHRHMPRMCKERLLRRRQSAACFTVKAAVLRIFAAHGQWQGPSLCIDRGFAIGRASMVIGKGDTRG